MTRTLTLCLCAGLSVGSAQPVAADCGMKHSVGYYSDPAIVVRTTDGACCVHPGALETGNPDMAHSDTTALHNLYAREMLAAEVLGAHQDRARTKDDPEMTALYGRMMVERLRTASRARQAYYRSDAALPVVTVQVTLPDLPATESTVASMPEPVDWHAGMEASYDTVQAPTVVALVQEVRTAKTQDADYIAGARAYYTEQVAGSRQELSDSEILARFHGKQAAEASAMRSMADQARASDRSDLAAVFERIAGDHDTLAEKSGELLRVRGIEPGPATTSVPTPTAGESVEHSWNHHQHMLTELGDMYLQAQDSEVRDLLNTAIRGATEHLDQLMPYVPGANTP